MADAYAAESKDDLGRRLKKLFRADREFSADWRKDAKEEFAFVAGEQYSEADKAHLKEMMRPVITMNRTQTIINAVSGQEMANRQEVHYLPREEGDVKPNELLTEAARWFRDVAAGDDEDSEAFLHNIICGMGWTDCTMDFDADEAGEPDMAAVNPLEMWWDRNARKNCLTDAERVWRVRKLPLSKAKEMFPDADESDLDASWAKVDADEGEIKDQDEERLYEDDGSEDSDDDDQVTIVHCQYIVRRKFWDVISPLSGTRSEMSDKDFKKYSKRVGDLGLPIKGSPKTKRVIRDCWLGRDVLQENDALCQDKFRYQCITGYRDETKGTFYGLVRGMMDPQRWANKWLSQTLDIMNSNAKGGLLAEDGITDNPRQLEKDWARADKITWLRDGSLSGPNGPRVIPKQAGQFPQGFYQLMEFAFEMISSVPGISPELMGQANRDQPASLEFQRRQAGMTILQPLLKNLKRYRKENGHVILYILQNHMSDGRLIRVLGEGQAQYVKLIKQADVKYDIIVDDAPTSPNQKEMIWAMIGEHFWEMPPQLQSVFVKYSPWPTSVAQEFEKAVEAQSSSPMAQIQQKMAAATVELESAKAELAKQQAEKTMVDAQKVLSTMSGADPQMQAEAAAEMQRVQAEQAMALEKHQGEMARMQLDAQLAKDKAELDARLKLQSAQQAAALQQQTAAQDSQIKQQSAAQSSQLKEKESAAKTADKMPAIQIQHGAKDIMGPIGEAMAAHTTALAGHMAKQTEAMASMAKALTAPKRIVKDAKGRAVGVETVAG